MRKFLLAIAIAVALLIAVAGPAAAPIYMDF